jgi:DNA replication protein DnaC
MTTKKEMTRLIIEYCKALRLPSIRRLFETEIAEANLRDVSYEEFLFNLLQKENDLRIENGKKNRIRLANFPWKKYLEDSVVEYLPEDAKKKLKTLSSLEFIKTGQNVILAGNSGTGNYRKNLVMERFSETA